MLLPPVNASSSSLFFLSFFLFCHRVSFSPFHSQFLILHSFCFSHCLFPLINIFFDLIHPLVSFHWFSSHTSSLSVRVCSCSRYFLLYYPSLFNLLLFTCSSLPIHLFHPCCPSFLTCACSPFLLFLFFQHCFTFLFFYFLFIFCLSPSGSRFPSTFPSHISFSFTQSAASLLSPFVAHVPRFLLFSSHPD